MTEEKEFFDFDSIYHEYHKDVYRFALYLTRDKETARDLFQDTWMRVVKNRGRVRSSGNIKAWILTITMNLHRDKLRKKKVRKLFMQRKKGEIRSHPLNDKNSCSPVRLLELNSAGKAVFQAVDTLSHRQRRVFLLKEMEGLKNAEIAGIMQIPLGTVKSLMHRAVKNLQQRLQDYAPCVQTRTRRKK